MWKWLTSMKYHFTLWSMAMYKKTRVSLTTGAKGNDLFASNSKLQISSIRYQVSDIRYQVSDIKNKISSIKYHITSMKYQFSDIKYISSIIHQVKIVFLKRIAKNFCLTKCAPFCQISKFWALVLQTSLFWWY